ncbi:methyl-accepting chemotaxis protein [Leptospira ilyithenensis]|uniref:Methyl-accepting chemotaxis protein n=1 Tax=Leptospira ilyithenensis TaxID=2484901 RepID=A0A4R9LN99_9LEPT|nr:methyl-accepting chemotaxis protein [Leptospira ilyithenensis]TGN08474.1 methyl-accepting chemotaxis protein [Leptospira ilyithenensis]
MSIRLRISLYISFVLFIGFFILTSIQSYQTFVNLKEEVEQGANVTAERWSFEVMEQLNTMMGVTRGFRFPLMFASPPRDQVISTMREILKRNFNYFAMWVCYEPNAYDKQDFRFKNKPGHDSTGRFVPYLYQTEKEGNIQIEALKNYDNLDGTGDYYQITRKTDKMSVVGPYDYKVGSKNVLMISLVTPISLPGKFYGAAGLDIDLKNLQERIGDKKPFRGQGYIALISPNGIYAMNGDDKSQLGKKIFDADELKVYLENNKEGKRFTHVSNGYTHYYFPFHIGKDPKFWTMQVSIPNSLYFKSVGKIVLESSIISLLILIFVLIVLNLIFQRLVSRGLTIAMHFSSRIADGDLTAVNHYKKTDEIGHLLQSMTGMKESLFSMISQIKVSSEKLGSHSTEMTRTSENFSDIAQTQASAAEESSAAVEELSASADHVGRSMETAVGKMREIDFNVVRLREQILSINQEMQSLAKLATDSKEQAVIGEKAMSSSTDAMEEIGDRASRITEVLDIITEISEKINLLALNAAIEAARAGDAGRGFAVVAEEIGKLAGQTSHSVQEIGGLVESTNLAVTNGNAKVEEAAKVLRSLNLSVNEFESSANKVLVAVKSQETNTKDIGESATALTTLNLQIEEAVFEQKRATEEITKTILSISDGTQEVASGADNLTNLSADMQRQAEHLSRLIGRFKV